MKDAMRARFWLMVGGEGEGVDTDRMSSFETCRRG